MSIDLKTVMEGLRVDVQQNYVSDIVNDTSDIMMTCKKT